MAKSLLLADDSTTIQKVVELCLGQEDITVVAAKGADEALARARDLRPDIIVVDVFMPGKSGYDLAAAIRADPALHLVPILLLQSQNQPFDEARARDSGANGWIAKPFQSQVLIDNVKQLLSARPAVTAPAPARPAPNPAATVPPPAPAGQRVATQVPPAKVPAPLPAAAPRPAAPAPVSTPRAPTPAAASAAPRPAAPAAPAAAAAARPAAPAAPRPPGAPAAVAGTPRPPGVPPPAAPRPPGAPAVAGTPRPPGAPGPIAAGRPAAAATVGTPRPPGAAPAPAPRPPAPAPQLTAQNHEALLREALTKASKEMIERVIWEVVPELAETMIKEELARLIKARETK